VFASIIVLLLVTLGVAFGGVRLPAPVWARLIVTLIAGAIPFCALGPARTPSSRTAAAIRGGRDPACSILNRLPDSQTVVSKALPAG
jgi:hypothetical protein